MWMILAIMVVELVVMHPLIALWSVSVAGVLSAVSVVGIGWLLWCVRSFSRLTVELKDDELIMGAGSLKCCRVPVDAIAYATGEIDKVILDAKGTLNLALIAWPNVLVELRQPLSQGRRSIRRIAHRLDDAPAFLSAMDAAHG